MSAYFNSWVPLAGYGTAMMVGAGSAWGTGFGRPPTRTDPHASQADLFPRHGRGQTIPDVFRMPNRNVIYIGAARLSDPKLGLS